MTEINVIWGAPGSGKTTYVNENKDENDLIFDYDCIMRDLSGRHLHDHNHDLDAYVLGFRDKILSLLATETDINEAWLIIALPTNDTCKTLDTLGANYIFMESSKDECLERVANDDDRQDKDKASQAVEEWFERFEDSQNNRAEAVIMNWYEIKAEAAEDKAEVWIYDFIGEDFFGEGIGAKKFVDELNDISASNIDLHINSPGGSVREGQAIHNAIARHPAKVTTYVDGLAASIASTVALAGDEVIMADNALMMIHKAWTIGMGNADELHHTADVLAKHDQTIEAIYQRKSGQDLKTIQNAMAEETWFTAQEAVDFGLADSVEEGLKAVALSITPEIMARFKNAPDALKPGGDGGLVLGKATVNIDGVELSEPVTITIVNNSLDPAGAAVPNSDGASQTEDSQPYDWELERIRARK